MNDGGGDGVCVCVCVCVCISKMTDPLTVVLPVFVDVTVLDPC